MRPTDYSTEALPEIRNLRLREFTVKPKCPKCGSVLVVTRPWFAGLRWRLFQTLFCGFRTLYCEGGADPEIEVPIPGGSVKGRAVCASVTREHLHIQCDRCNFIQLMETASC